MIKKVSTSNYSWVCFQCQFVARKAKTLNMTPLCHVCQKEMSCLGYKVPIPKKSNKKKWEELQCWFVFSKIEKAEENQKIKVQRKHELEKEIIKIEKLKDCKEKRRNIKELKCALERYS